MRRRLPIALAIALTCSCVAHAQPDAYERIRAAYAPYLNEQDPFSLPMKIASLASDEYKFWRGSKDLFFQWGKQHCQDWLKDDKAFLPNHGDLHLGNIGTYVSEDGLGTLAFGMVDFDDSARLPFEFELLQGLVTLELIARQNKIGLDAAERAQLDARLFDTYKLAVNSRRSATEMLKSHSVVSKMLSKAGKKPYRDELAKFTEAGKFRRVVRKKEKITDILDPVDTTRWAAFSQAILDAARQDDRLGKLMPEASLKTIRKQMKDVVRRTRIGSSGSQGLNKYFVLLDKPFAGVDHDVILYLKQEIPTAAERSGIIPRDPRPAGERCAADMDKMTEPRAFLCSWADLEGQSYWVHFKEPWSEEIDFDDVKDFGQLKEMAEIWATVVGATHRDEGRFELILPRLTPELQSQIRARSEAYLDYQRAAFEAFKSNASVVESTASATAAIERVGSR